jgi:outer membrane protein insertion porin family
VTRAKRRFDTGRKVLASLLSAALLAPPLPAAAQTRPATLPVSAVPPELAGRNVEEVRIIGRTKPLGSELIGQITHQIRTREGDRFDPSAVEGDYQRVYGLRKFSNVEARVEPTATGVIVIFEVTEQSQIKEIRFRGNEEVDTKALQDTVNLKVGESIDWFRLSLAKEAIERLYRSKNYPHAHVLIDQDELARNGVVVFTVVEGPRVRVRKVRVLGNKSFTDSKIKDEIKTKSWFPLLVPGEFDPEQVDQDVASIRQHYENHGFFDVRVGRKIVVSPNQKEVMVDFVIEEGRRYVVERVTFKFPGSKSVEESQLRKDLKLVEGRFYDADLLKRDIRQIVRVYSPLGFIYVSQDPNPDPDYMRIRDERIFRKEAGKVELVYIIAEGKPFRLGPIIVKGNAKTMDKIVLREMRVEPGELYNSAEVQSAQDRIKATGLYSAVTMIPITPPNAPVEVGEGEPGTRALLVEVTETQSARFMFGAGLTSNSGVMGNITYEQRNFDISNWPANASEFFSSRAFSGAGQTFRLSLEPGTELSRARVDFIEPWIFDQPYSFGASAYLAQRIRPGWDEDRLGARLSLGKRFSDIWSAKVSLRAEDVSIRDIRDEANRAPEILQAEGHSALTSVGLEVRRDTTDSPLLPSKGTITTAGWEHFGALGGDFDFDRLVAGWNWFGTVYEDLLDRKTIVALRADAGYITGDTPFFERFYAGGIGSLRGFRYRGVSPRSGIDQDPIGGNFTLTGSIELSFPLAGDVLRGVLFTDAGTVERNLESGTIRSSVGFGFRLSLPFLGQLPLAFDFGFPITKDDQDDTRLFSFSLGLVQ